MKRTVFVLICTLVSAQIIAQPSWVGGYVRDAISGDPIPDAMLLIEEQSTGTISERNGSFILKTNLTGKSKVLVTHLGYQSHIEIIPWTRGDTAHINISLVPSPIQLQNLEVTAERDNKWKRQYKRFSRDFLGTSPHALKCEILNPYVLEFSEESDNSLVARAEEVLKIENQSTGYMVFFQLDHFVSKGTNVSYSGKPYFTPLKTDNDKMEKKWQRNREYIYSGSRQHFMQSLLAGSSKLEGFEVYNASFTADGQVKTLKRVKPENLLSFDESSYQMSISRPLKIVYTKKSLISQVKPGELATNHQHPVSYLIASTATIDLSSQGQLLKPELVSEFGVWADNRVADLLPADYHQTEVSDWPKSEVVQKYPVKNGFQLNNLLIPIEEIHRGGPPRDGIPSIDDPKFDKASKSTLSELDMVLGVTIDGISKAYPVNIMNWHEVVNDMFDEVAVVITYCPLCGSGIAFESNNDGKDLQFGVSGLLYSSDVLLYDRNTESLWSQLMMQAVSGEYSGEPLEPLSTFYGTWMDWREMHPTSLVLNENTGFSRDYAKSPYTGYAQTERLMFPVKNVKTGKFSNKEMVLVVKSKDGTMKAFPKTELDQSKEDIQCFAGSTEVNILKNGEVQVDGGEYFYTYWFAWQAFYPDGMVYKHKD